MNQNARPRAVVVTDEKPIAVLAVVFAITTTVLVLAMLMFVRPALAEPSSTTENAVRGVITNQIEAFRRDDARGAYNFAAPSIQQRFPTADIFMDMVRRGYAPVYRPQDFDFGAIEGNDDRVRQQVDIVGPDNDLWTAYYTLQRERKGTWLITGVRLVKQPGISS